MGLFLTCGYPHPHTTLPLLNTLWESGADFLELGIPFSDPMAEGPVIQQTSEVALRNGTTVSTTLETAAAFRAQNADAPLFLMGYANPVFRYGLETFFEDARSSGVDGLILADLSIDESAPFEDAAKAAGIDLVHLVSPSTPDNRVVEIDRRSSGFVYAVSVSGLTGSRLNTLDVVQEHLKRLSCLVRKNPLMVGFGIDSFDTAVALSRHTDGFIVGSALLREIGRVWDLHDQTETQRLAQIGAFVRELKFGTER